MSSSFREIRSVAARHGLRELCSDIYSEGEVIFTHVETADGTRYQLANSMTNREVSLTAEARHHLLIVIPESKHPMASVSIFATARVLLFYNEVCGLADRAFHAGTSDFTRPWVQTQNHRYFLVQKA
jgi:hypothetical protein